MRTILISRKWTWLLAALILVVLTSALVVPRVSAFARPGPPLILVPGAVALSGGAFLAAYRRKSRLRK